jgi:HAD superfamily hydrolase (TIGR01509 family)
LATPAAILFDLGGVLLPFDRERRVRAIVQRLGVTADAVRAVFDGDLPRRMDLGEADAGDFAAAFSALAGRAVSAGEARELILSVFEAPNAALWDRAAALRAQAVVGGFSDNPAFVRAVFPTGAALDPMIFSSEIGAMKPSDAAFTAAEARLARQGADILFIDDSGANVAAALSRGWDAILYQSNGQLAAALGQRGLA